MSKEENNGWIKIEDGGKIPDYDVPVLVYWEWTSTGKNPNKYEEIEIAIIASANEGKGYKRYDWQVVKDYQSIEPLFWQPLPPKPIKE